MAKIEVIEKARGKEAFTYTVKVDGRTHEVTLTKDYCQHLTGGYDQPEELVKQSFKFLLENEKPEDIMQQFDLKQINSYFPGYETSVRSLLA